MHGERAHTKSSIGTIVCLCFATMLCMMHCTRASTAKAHVLHASALNFEYLAKWGRYRT